MQNIIQYTNILEVKSSVCICWPTNLWSW